MELVEDIKVLSWRWCLTRLKILSCLFYEWSWNPRKCLARQQCPGAGLGVLFVLLSCFLHLTNVVLAACLLSVLGFLLDLCRLVFGSVAEMLFRLQEQLVVLGFWLSVPTAGGCRVCFWLGQQVRYRLLVWEASLGLQGLVVVLLFSAICMLL